MPAKKAAAAAPKKPAASPAHASYKDMIKEAILNLKDRSGSSRPAIKKYVKANNKGLLITSEKQFDSLFNKALKNGVEKGDFTQPKGTSGPVKLAKKETKPPAKAAAKKEPEAKEPKETKATKEPKPKPTTTSATKKAPKKTPTKAATTKKAPATKKTAPATPKANTAKPRAKKTAKPSTSAPAVVDVPQVLTKTKSGRVTKTKQTAPTATKAGASKKTPGKKATPKKSTTPKKAEATG